MVYLDPRRDTTLSSPSFRATPQLGMSLMELKCDLLGSAPPRID